MENLNNRYEFVYFFDVENGNPNGDPDAGNMPRIDAETSHGIVTDVCLKRKIRNYAELTRSDSDGYNIYVKENSILNKQHEKAYIALDKKPSNTLPADEKGAALTQWMCNNFFDVRTFGAVMTTKVNCGQVRGPVQINFSQSMDPVMPEEITITRMAATNEEELKKNKEGDDEKAPNRTMGKKTFVPYGLYKTEGYISAYFAEKTGFSEDDLNFLWESLINMFDHDHSAARGKMNARKLIVFKHSSKQGSAPAHKLFELVKVERDNDPSAPPRSFSDYSISINHDAVPEGVEIIEKL